MSLSSNGGFVPPPNMSQEFQIEGMPSLGRVDPTQKFPSRDIEPAPGQVGALDYFHGKGMQQFVINEYMSTITIGRDRTCTINFHEFTGGSGISARHVEIVYDKDSQLKDEDGNYIRFHVQNISNTNGVQHNGVTLDKQAKLPLHHRDSIIIGHNPEIKFIFVDSARTPKGIHLLYDLRTKIGSGNFSEVKLGISRKNGKKYAIKILDRERFESFSRKRETKLDFQTEIDTLIKLKHTNIIRYFEYKEEGNLKYMVTEYLEGGDLLQRLLDVGKYSERGTKFVFTQLLFGLKYLHDQRIVHRDLKPENVLLSDRSDIPKAKIADFGLARMQPHSTNLGGTQLFKTFCGTPHYFAPELIKSQQGVCVGYGKEVDLWSAGVILYILLSGTPPFEDENLYQQIVEGRVVFDCSDWDDVPSCAKELVKQLMEVSPKKRYSVDQTLQHEFVRPVVHILAKKRPRSPSPTVPGRSKDKLDNDTMTDVQSVATPIKTAKITDSQTMKDVEMT